MIWPVRPRNLMEDLKYVGTGLGQEHLEQVISQSSIRQLWRTQL
jgi:hypothetical protein